MTGGGNETPTTSPANPPSDRPWRAVAGFVVLAIGLSWIPWLTLLITTGDPFVDPMSIALFVAGGFGPTLAGVILAIVSQGRAGFRRLISDLRRGRLGRWYGLLLLPLPVIVIAVAVTVSLGEASWELAAPAHLILLPTALLGGLVLGGLEEIGWRGFLQPRLQDHMTALTGSVIVGLVWALWHGPLFFLESTSQASSSPFWFTVHAVALSVILTWIYNGTAGSLLLVVLFHGATNGWYEWVIAGLAPDAAAGFLRPAGVLMTLFAMWLIFRHRPDNLAALSRRGWHNRSVSPSGATHEQDPL